MKYYLEERIGNPDLFTGRKKELTFFLKWIDDIRDRKSKSTAILARRKMGKTAVLERLYNITFAKNSGIIPFYYEVKEGKKWAIEFFKDFFLTFIYQYIAFKTRKREYLILYRRYNFQKAIEAAKKEGLDYLTDAIEEIEDAAKGESVDAMWEMVRNAPRFIAEHQREFIVQMIDEFQFLNSEIYWDKEKRSRADDLAGAYLSTAESKISPLLVSGSWVGWLMNDLIMMLPGRFVFEFMENMPEEEAVEMIFKYSQFFEVSITEEIAYILYELTEGSPFYISSVIRSRYREKDLTTIDGLLNVLEFETLDNRGEIKRTWMEYVNTAFYRVNDRNAKNIVLYLCKNREREVTRKELLEELHLEISDGELERRLKSLIKADIIEQGRSNFRYKGVRDNIFDKVFRGVYHEEIEEFDVRELSNEYRAMYMEMKERYYKLLGKYNYSKGYFAEYIIINRLKYRAYRENDYLKSLTSNLPDDFEFTEYERVWSYRITPEYARNMEIDIYAKTEGEGYSVIVEVKNRETKRFTLEEAGEFIGKAEELKEIEGLEKAVVLVFSRPGFTEEAEDFCLRNKIAYSDDEKWLE